MEGARVAVGRSCPAGFLAGEGPRAEFLREKRHERKNRDHSNARGIAPEILAQGVVKESLNLLTEWTVEADKAVEF